MNSFRSIAAMTALAACIAAPFVAQTLLTVNLGVLNLLR
jgi:hypothetical protein